MNYTDTQLKQALAKMLPDKTAGLNEHGTLKWYSQPNGYFFQEPVLDTELLHLCWMVEEELKNTRYGLWCIYKDLVDFHATWQQRIIALAKVKGVEIV